MPRITDKEWDDVRHAFQTSLMVDTSIASLAQNLEGPEWPNAAKDETPGIYIDLNMSEALMMLRRRGMGPDNLDLLADIMRETLAFDQPFGDMVEQVQSNASKDNAFLKNLAKLEIPESYPIDLVAFSKDTQDFCKLEHIDTLGQFAVFAQNMAQSVIVGGDFRNFLNALAQSDTSTLAQFLPLRAGQKGLQLPEAIAGGLANVEPVMCMALARKCGLKLNKEQEAEVLQASASRFDVVESELRLRTSRLTADLFKPQLAILQAAMAAGTSVERLVAPLANAQLEAIVAGQLRPLLRTATPRTQSATAPKRGFWARLFGRR